MAKIKTIGQAVPAILTWMIAESCLEKAGIEPTKKLVNGMVARANYHFNDLKSFRKSVLGRGNKGRDFLYSIMSHWVESRYWEKHDVLPELYKPYQQEIPNYNK